MVEPTPAEWKAARGAAAAAEITDVVVGDSATSWREAGFEAHPARGVLKYVEHWARSWRRSRPVLHYFADRSPADRPPPRCLDPQVMFAGGRYDHHEETGVCVVGGVRFHLDGAQGPKVRAASPRPKLAPEGTEFRVEWAHRIFEIRF